jgi:hypothetical protein
MAVCLSFLLFIKERNLLLLLLVLWKLWVVPNPAQYLPKSVCLAVDATVGNAAFFHRQ